MFYIGWGIDYQVITIGDTVVIGAGSLLWGGAGLSHWLPGVAGGIKISLSDSVQLGNKLTVHFKPLF